MEGLENLPPDTASNQLMCFLQNSQPVGQAASAIQRSINLPTSSSLTPDMDYGSHCEYAQGKPETQVAPQLHLDRYTWIIPLNLFLVIKPSFDVAFQMRPQSDKLLRTRAKTGVKVFLGTKPTHL